jgi:hypothetical protein
VHRLLDADPNGLHALRKVRRCRNPTTETHCATNPEAPISKEEKEMTCARYGIFQHLRFTRRRQN